MSRPSFTGSAGSIPRLLSRAPSLYTIVGNHELVVDGRHHRFLLGIRTAEYKGNRHFLGLVSCTYERSRSWKNSPELLQREWMREMLMRARTPENTESYRGQFEQLFEPLLTEAAGAERNGNTRSANKIRAFVHATREDLEYSLRHH